MPKPIQECPDCGSDNLNDCWQTGRKLRQGCNECSWEGENRIPEKREIKTTKTTMAGHFGGWTYEIYDQYGYPSVASRSYRSEEEAVEAALKEKKSKEKHNSNELPITILIWPSTVTVEAKVIT